MTGLRKTNAVNALIGYNQRFNLGYKNKEIQAMSIGELRKINEWIRKKHNLPTCGNGRLD